MNQTACALILAGGKGSRMKSGASKPLKEILFQPVIDWILDGLEPCGFSHVAAVIPQDAPELEEKLAGKAACIIQSTPRGTADAVKTAWDFLVPYQEVLVLPGDAPFLDHQAIVDAYQLLEEEGGSACLIAAAPAYPFGDGVFCRVENRRVTALANRQEGPGGTWLKSAGAGWFSVKALGRYLPSLPCPQGEDSLEAVLEQMVRGGEKVLALDSQNPMCILDANTKRDLMELNSLARMKVLETHMENGVEFPSLDGVLISPKTTIGEDTVILPGTILKGCNQIGRNCVVGPQSMMWDSQMGDGCIFNASQMTQSQLGNQVKVGPYCHLRPGSRLADRVKVGDFVEIKNSTIGEKTSLAHLTYIGDSEMGKGINFGGGCITCNYDGKTKHRTVVKDRAFIGCNTNLVAPVTVGEGAFIAAGSTITQDVQPDALAIARGRQAEKPGWAKQWFSTPPQEKKEG